MTLVTLAAASGFSFSELAIKPRPETPTTADPVVGHGIVGIVPGTVSCTGREAVGETAGIGRK